MIPTKDENPNGLHQRYAPITYADGSSTDPGAVYFVLRLDPGGDDDEHTVACRKAARAYAKAVVGTHLAIVGHELEVLIDELDGIRCRR